jgi:aldehyde dehydrogenase (NAD+)
LIAEACARDNKIVSLEMGGKNAIIVMDDADVDNAVEGSLWGAFGTSGQRCTASSRLVVHKKIYKKFCEKLVEKVKRLRVGNGLDSKTEVGPVINDQAMDKILGYIHIGKNQDKATLACGGNRLSKGDYKNGYFIEPTVFTDVSPKMRIGQEEIFGPVTSVIPFSTLDEAIDIVNGFLRDAGALHRHLLCQFGDDRCRGSPAFRRYKKYRQRPSRSRHAGA